MTSGIKPTTFWFVGYCLNQTGHHKPLNGIILSKNLSDKPVEQIIG
jgi:hypothetical protein